MQIADMAAQILKFRPIPRVCVHGSAQACFLVGRGTGRKSRQGNPNPAPPRVPSTVGSTPCGTATSLALIGCIEVNFFNLWVVAGASIPGQRGLVGPDGGGEAHDQRVGSQLMADRGFG